MLASDCISPYPKPTNKSTSRYTVRYLQHSLNLTAKIHTPKRSRLLVNLCTFLGNFVNVPLNEANGDCKETLAKKNAKKLLVPASINHF